MNRSRLAIALVAMALTGCARPGERALRSLERGLDELVSLVERRDRGELDEAGFSAALAQVERNGRATERLCMDAARSAGPEERAELDRRWRELSERLAARLSTHSSPRPLHEE